MYYLQSRYYNPKWERFINADDVIGQDGELLSHNLFSYCDNNPENREDSDGHFWGFITVAAVIIGLPVEAAIVVGAGVVIGTAALGYTTGTYIKHEIQKHRIAFKSNKKSKNNTKSKPKIKYPSNNSSKSPGKGWEWRGKGTPESGKGNWYNPKTGEKLNPDLGHGEPIGAHWDYTAPDGTQWRLFPSGDIEPK